VFQNGIDPEPSSLVLAGAGRAHDYITAFSLGLGAVLAGCLVILGLAPGITAPLLAGLAALLLALHARDLLGVLARLGVLLPGVIGFGAILAGRTLDAPATDRPIALVVLLGVVAVLVALSRVLPGHRMMPHWGRIGDLTQSAAAMAIIPLVPAVIGLYAKVRAGWS
jgi:hypothetical protein